ncbi:unnamed protein product [Eretmochelys imbricata]
MDSQRDEAIFLDIPDSALEVLNREQDGSQNQQTAFPEMTEDDLSSVIPQEEMLKGTKKFPSESATVGSKGMRHFDFEHIQNLITQNQPSLKRAKKSTTKTAAYRSKGVNPPPHPHFDLPCTTRAKKNLPLQGRGHW